MSNLEGANVFRLLGKHQTEPRPGSRFLRNVLGCLGKYINFGLSWKIAASPTKMNDPFRTKRQSTPAKCAFYPKFTFHGNEEPQPHPPGASECHMSCFPQVIFSKFG